ncbi:MAG: hypothetical protein P0Y66_21715 [Candidatus Kaistia colombiensis]|nr:MAG: hypothetical protein P0Y66_21715 [Kaistia sp.]
MTVPSASRVTSMSPFSTAAATIDIVWVTRPLPFVAVSDACRCHQMTPAATATARIRLHRSHPSDRRWTTSDFSASSTLGMALSYSVGSELAPPQHGKNRT